MLLGAIATLVACWWASPIVLECRTDHRAELAMAVGAVRAVEGRLCGGFVHAPYPTSLRQGKAVRRVSRALNRELERQNSPSLIATLATLQTLAAQKERLDAVRNLRKATTLAPDDARPWSDLAALHLELAKDRAPGNYPHALEASLRAVALDPKLPEARFNLALALEKNFLSWDARAAWLDYARLDPGSAWTAEADEHLRALRRPSADEIWDVRQIKLEKAIVRGDSTAVRRLVREFPIRARTFADEELLPRWASAELGHNPSSAYTLLRGARWIGEELDAAIAERMTIDSVVAIEQALQSAPLRRELGRGYDDYVAGSSFCLANQPARGEPLLLAARRALERAASPMAKWAGLQLAVCAYRASHFDRALGMLADLLASPETDHYPTLRGRALWMQGLVNLSAGEPALALPAYQEALAVFERLAAREEQGAMHYLKAQALQYVGDAEGAWRSLFRGVELATAEGHPWRRYSALILMADAAAKEGLRRAALRYETEALRIAREQEDAPAAAFSLGRRALLLAGLGRAGRAEHNLRRGRDELAKIEDAHERWQREADLLLTHGRIHASRDCSALRSLNRAVCLYCSGDQIFKLLDAFSVRARALRACSQEEAAERDLLAGIAEFERERERLTDAVHRRMFFDRARELFDELISLTLERGDQGIAAFALAEQSRARLLLDRMVGTHWLTASEIGQRLPDQHALVAYVSLPRELVIFLLRRGAPLRMYRRPFSSDEVGSAITGLLRTIDREASGRAFVEASASLHELLLAPLRAELREGETLVFVPDGALYHVPFAALYDVGRQRFLVEDHASTVIPSASVFVEGCRRSKSTCGDSRALVLADPEIDPLRFPDLVPLRGARAEAAALKKLYRQQASVLVGRQATEKAFMRDAGVHSILHFGVHARGSLEAPREAHLLLAEARPGSDGVLTAGAIERLAFNCTRIVCLSACLSGGGAEAASEGPLSLARAFFAAGVPQTIATLWAIDDESSPEFVTELHRRLRDGLPAEKALRQAQLLFITQSRLDPELLHTWAAYQALGCTS